MDEAALERRLLVSPRPSDIYAPPAYGHIHHEIGRKGVTLMLLWGEYDLAPVVPDTVQSLR